MSTAGAPAVTHACLLVGLAVLGRAAEERGRGTLRPAAERQVVLFRFGRFLVARRCGLVRLAEIEIAGRGFERVRLRVGRRALLAVALGVRAAGPARALTLAMTALAFAMTALA